MDILHQPESSRHESHPVWIWITLILTLLVGLTGCQQIFPYLSTPTTPARVQVETTATFTPTATTIATQKPTPTNTPEATPTSIFEIPGDGFLVYTTQQGDTLPAIAARFGVSTAAIRAESGLSAEGLLPIGQDMLIPDTLEDALPFSSPILPDCEVPYGPSVVGFDASAFAIEAGGFLAGYVETVDEESLGGPEIVQRVAVETSTNPRLLLAFLEYQSGWVFGHPEGAAEDSYPIGYGAGTDTGLYKELMITAKLLAQGFYGWRDGSLLEITFLDGSTARLSPELNVGSTALMRLFATLYPQAGWEENLFGESSFLVFYQTLFGDPWERSAAVEPYLTGATTQPDLTLPFAVGEGWSLTGGPHITWQTGTPWGALDFAPITGEPTCAVSTLWVTASAPGLVVRSEHSVVAIDLDGDGDEGTGWVLIYQHIAAEGRAAVGTWLAQDAPVGHPSCEGGHTTGTHLHFARKFNGEWVGVGSPLPLVLSGWQAYAGEKAYQGYLLKGEETITASPNGSGGSLIIRDE